MNWKVYYLVFVALLVTSYSNSQSNLLNAIEVDQIGKQSKEKIAADNDTPLSYGYIDDRDILWFMPRDEYDFDIKADQQMFTYWTSLNYTTLVDIYQTIRAEGFYWLNLVRKEIYKKVK